MGDPRVIVAAWGWNSAGIEIRLPASRPQLEALDGELDVVERGSDARTDQEFCLQITPSRLYLPS